MKKSLLITLITAAMAMSANAQDNSGGSSESGIGGLSTTTIVGGAIGLGIVGSIIASNDGNSTVDETTPDAECAAGDELVDGICYNVTNTLTTTNTNGVTTTITVPVTTTYMPTVPQ